MPNPFFRFKQFTVYHDRCAMKVTTDACLFGAWTAAAIRSSGAERGRFLDVGAGTGLLSLMVAQKHNASIDAVEIDPAAAEQAAENVQASPWNNAIHLFNEDVLAWGTDRVYDVIFSNPPFYENEIRSGKRASNIAHHNEGLQLADLFMFIKKHLKEDGAFYLLLPAKRKKEIEGLLKKHGLFAEQIVQVQQTLKHQPFRLMIQGCLTKSASPQETVLSIKDNSDAYTQRFVELLQPYYLYL